MGLFSLSNILLEGSEIKSAKVTSANIINIDNIGYVDKEIARHSFVQEGYNAILEMNAFYCNAEKEFYTKVMGSYGDDNIINESFSDFFNKIKDIIKKFIEWLKKVFKEFVAKLAALVGSEKYIKKNAKLLNKFSSEDEFEFQGYKFTRINDVSLPAAKALDAFNGNTATGGESFFTNIATKLLTTGQDDESNKYYYDNDDKWNNADANDTERARRNAATEKLNQALSTQIDSLNDGLDDYYESFRGIVLGEQNKKYDAREFTDRLFEIFRDDSNTTSSITIDSSFVMDAHRRFDKYKDTIKDIEKTQKDMIKDYEDLEKQLDKLIKYNKSTRQVDFNTDFRPYTAGQISKLGNLDNKIIYDSSSADKMQSWLKIQSSKVNQMCQIHTQAFSAKLEAAKDCFKQDKQILNKAIQQILKRSDKEGF